MRLSDFSHAKRRIANRSAFTLAEVVMSVAIIAVIFGGVLSGYVQAARRSEWSGYSLAAQAFSIQQLEQARSAIWDLSLQKNELTNLNLNAWSYHSSSKTWKGYSYGILDLPIAKTNAPMLATNFVTVSMLTPAGAPAGVSVQMLRVDTVWVFYAFGGARLYTNTVVNYFAPDNRDPSTL